LVDFRTFALVQSHLHFFPKGSKKCNRRQGRGGGGEEEKKKKKKTGKMNGNLPKSWSKEEEERWRR